MQNSFIEYCLAGELKMGMPQNIPIYLVVWQVLLEMILSLMDHYGSQGHRESRGGPGKAFMCKKDAKKKIQLINYAYIGSTCLHMPKSFCEALLIILPNRSLIESSQKKGKQKVKKQRGDDTAHRCKNHKNKCLMGPFKSLGAPGKYPLSTLPSN